MSSSREKQLNRKDYGSYISGNAIRSDSFARLNESARLNGSARLSEYARQNEAIRKERLAYERKEHAARRNRDRARYMNFRYVLFLSIAVFVTAVTLLGYVKSRSELTISIKNVASLERELSSLKLSNDEQLARINASVNLEEIKRIAVEELGMTYAKEGQVVLIASEGSDYVRQLHSLE